MRIKKVLLVMSNKASEAESKALQNAAKDLRYCGVEVVELTVTEKTVTPEDLATFDRVQIYGNTITHEVLAIAQDAVRLGVQVLRKAYKWSVQPVCRCCADFHRIAGGGTFCEHYMRTKEERLCAPIGVWCAYFQEREGNKYVDPGDHAGTGSTGTESGVRMDAAAAPGNGADVQERSDQS